MRWLASLLLLSLSASAHPPSGQTQVVVVMKMASCSVCAGQMQRLSSAELGVPLMGITHDPQPMADRVTQTTGVPTYSHAEGIASMGLWLEDQGIAMPAVVVYDRCGVETGRVVGRRPGADATRAVRQLVEQANAVTGCGKPVS